MPNKIEMYEDMKERFWKIILGDVSRIDSPIRWYNFLFFVTKIAMVLLVVVFVSRGNYLYAIICGVSVILDVLNGFRLYKAYKLHKEIEGLIKR